MFAQAIQAQAKAQGSRPFLLFGDDVITWAAMADTVARAATWLDAQQVRQGDHVLLTADNSPTFVQLWFALRWLGAISVPLHTGATADAVRSIVDDAEVSYVVGDTRRVDEVLAAVPELESRASGFADSFDLVETVDRLRPAAAAPAGPGDVSHILYTSGTTGTPKGVVLSNESFLAGGRELAKAVGVDESDRIVLGLPLFHTNPQVYGVGVALATGCSVVVLPQFVPQEFLDQCARYRATGFTYVGTVLSLLLERTQRVPDHNLRFCVGGGAPGPLWRRVEENLGVPVYELYGMTETGGWVTATTRQHRRVGSCGQVRPDMECAILDSGDHILPPGQVGQIAVRPSRPGVLFDGYHRRPELTLSRFTNAWFHTGDLGAFDDDGFLHFHGRADETIRRGGENISPHDLQQMLDAHPDINEVAVVGVPDEVMGEEIKLVVVPRGHFSPGGLPGYLDGRLPRFAWPRYVEVVDALPKTPTQKVRLDLLRRNGPDVVDLKAHARSEVG